VKILLLGPDGQLGYELRPLLSALGEVCAISRTDLDIKDVSGLRDVLGRERPRVIVNATAYNEVDKAETDSGTALAINRDAVLVMGEYAKREGAALVHYSTDFVFDGTKGAPYVETDRTNPLSAYGKSKLSGEQALEGIEAPAIVLRTAWVYSLRRKSFVSMVHRLAREKKELRIVRDQIGSPTFCRDLARVSAVLVARLGKDPGGKATECRGLYHAAGEGACSRYELATSVIELDPKRHEHVVEAVEPATTDAFPTPARRPGNAPLDCEKLAQVFNVRLLPWRLALAEALSGTGQAT
jgi:dTDP-4-dehydrorhamnose reductase